MKCKFCSATIQKNEKHILEYDKEYGMLCRIEGAFQNYNKLIGG